MEQQPLNQNHMRLPPPVDFITNANNDQITSDQTHRQSSQQEIQPPAGHLHSVSTKLSSPLPTNPSASPFSTGSNHHQQQPPQNLQTSSSSLSPRPLGPLPACSPPSYAHAQQNHDPSTLDFPDPPSNELAPLQFNSSYDNSLNSLPSLASLTGTSTSSSRRFAPSSAASDTSYSPPPRPRAWPTGNPYSVYYNAPSAESPARMDIDGMSHVTRGPLSPDPMGGRASSVSLDDPDVRMAAEALGDLKADFVSSPQNRNTPMSSSPANNFGTPGPPEPLLSLVMTSGSLLAKPIEGTVSAYNTTKNFSPGFIKTPVDYIEGVVGSGLQMSGIEGGVRWFFRGKGRHQSSSDLESGEKSYKRRKVDSRGGSASVSRNQPSGFTPFASTNGPDAQQGQIMDPYGFTDKDHRRLSMSTIDTLPAYDDARSPAYTESANTVGQNDQITPTSSRPSSTTPTAWQSRLIMSTSGLSIAMSEESLRSLKYCLSWLRWANEHIGRVISALKDALDKYGNHPSQEDQVMTGSGSTSGGHQGDEQARHALGARIDALRADVLKTLQGVIETVSMYAGGALPDNARVLVRRHLTSLPQRFRLATQETNNATNAGETSSASTEESKEKEVRDGAQRVLVLAKEGLDMMAQVSGVLDGTIVSAEEWCERLGRKRREDEQQK
ncbi:Clock-controlled protein 8 [Cytospora mali]|uniref:Clock-controlled protein 8 n=1 Tax=Cytospora mali TaxID=578113 RepID=A0A194V774_CYTMA|nr:Clock-controlled protein 8 [Valsa mali var. pyri (nom. inval.)]